MTVTEAVDRRISIRAFRPDPVSGTVVRDILQAAARAPSGGNLQPWRDNRGGRLAQLAKNIDFFGAPVGLFFALDRKLGPPQWSDLGMYMQTVMLLAVERGLDTCAQEFWARLPKTVGAFLELPEDHMLFSGMALGYRDETAPINTLRTRRETVEDFAEMRGF